MYRLSTVQIRINNIFKCHIQECHCPRMQRKKKSKCQYNLFIKVWSTKVRKFRDNHLSNLKDSFLLSSKVTKWRTATTYEAEDAFSRPWFRWWIGVKWQFHHHVSVSMKCNIYHRQQKTPNCEIIRLQTWKGLNSCVLCSFIYFYFNKGCLHGFHFYWTQNLFS